MNRYGWAFLVLVVISVTLFWRAQSHLGKASDLEAASPSAAEAEKPKSIFESRGKSAPLISKVAAPSRRIAEESPMPVLRPARVFRPRDSDLGDTLDSIGLASWKIWRGIGITQKGSEPKDVRLTGEVAGYALFESNGFSGRLGQFDLSSPIAVYNDRTHKAGIITGSISVVLKQGVTWDDVAKDHALSLIAPFPQIRMYMVTSSRSPFDLSALLTELAGDSRIETSKPEVLSRDYNKN